MLEKENKPQASPDQGGGMTHVVHDSTLVGNGTIPSPLSVASFVMPNNELAINVNDPEIVGKQYQSFANAIAYLLALPTPPDSHNRWALRFSGTNLENIDFPQYIYPVGDGEFTSVLQGNVGFTSSGGNLI